MRKSISALLLLSIALCLTGCSGGVNTQTDTPAATVEAAKPAEPVEPLETDPSFSPETEAEYPPMDYSDELFEQLAGDFLFASGAGFWGTGLTVVQDGTFEGEYHDSNMGMEPSVYLCSFSGRFGDLKKLGETVYSMRIIEIRYENEPGAEEMRDNAQYFYTTPYGLTDPDEIMIYLPGTPAEKIPEGYVAWTRDIMDESGEATAIAIIYNEKEGAAFLKSATPEGD